MTEPIGYIDHLIGGSIVGWARVPSAAIAEVEIFVDGQPAGRTVANRFRDDLLAAGIGDGRHGFRWEIPDALPLTRESRVVARAGGTDLSGGGQTVASLLVDDSLRFDEDGVRVRRDHPLTSRVRPRLHLEPSAPGPDDRTIAERLMATYERMIRYEQNVLPADRRANHGIWELARTEYHSDFYQIVERRDVDELAKLLCNALRNGIAFGLGSGPGNFKNLVGVESREAHAADLHRRIVVAAEAVGALPHENPEQGRYGQNIQMTTDDVVAAIERVTGLIRRPPIMGMYGIALADGGIIDPRAPDDAYCAQRMKALYAGFKSVGICEIGGGFGGAALQTLRAGVVDRYTIVDLPSICLLQGFFLIKILGTDAVKLYGEDFPDRAANILPYWEFFDRGRQFDLVFNRDSMPEMPSARADDYLDEIAARGATFFSINQEGEAYGGQPGWKQLNVHNIVKHQGKLASLVRCPYWLRTGYVEEIFRPAR